MEVVVTTGAIGRAKLQSNHHHQQTNTQFFYRLDALPATQPTVSGKQPTNQSRTMKVFPGVSVQQDHTVRSCWGKLQGQLTLRAT